MPNVQRKAKPDPVAALPWVDVSMRWALMIAEVQLGRAQMLAFLHEIGLGQYERYPEDNSALTGKVTMGQYSDLLQELVQRFGDDGRRAVSEIGRVSNANSTHIFAAGAWGEAATSAIYQVPAAMRARTGLDAVRMLFEQIYRSASLPPLEISVEQQGDVYHYSVVQCASCAGWQSDGPICDMNTHYLQAGMDALFPEQKFQVREITCRAAGAPRCSWEIKAAGSE